VALSRSRTVATTALLAALALGGGSSASLAPETNALASISTLTLVAGPVLVRHAGAEFSQAHEGDLVAAGDTIRTGTAASVELTYFEGSSVRVDADAEIVVASLHAEAEGGAVQTIARAWNVLTKLIAGGTRFDVRTPSSTASVRG
jgi:hypothetical protein